ncbi:MAG: CHAT domain-containing protein, partial [Candidatus Aminicenantes bacterium]|nr:CHAT domain-containing protein [Candidatus Aminicenantes bacterium]NIM78819.1 CHAT domain-containing protein [Candidatus Aminicenantes bacterium]NIN18074.1 CHAT domain-containing protein [Candidatus Aminicenantes bacterium]NIN41973.1 CHAT domain-containing protein [Candidatus Aminicenantes bacterium]NIN84729.1 CHAT domain-containing protein [Candidatus Aminicenantes bacterium]
MIRAKVELDVRESRLAIRCKEAELDEWRDIKKNDQKQFDRWIEQYRQALKQHDHAAALFSIGQDMYKWLNGSGSWLKRLFDSVSDPPFIVEFTVSARPRDDELRFLEVPWELLAEKHQHLAADQYVMYCPVRRTGKRSEPGEPSPYRLHTVFMAAAPQGAGVPLRYEEEESALLDAAGASGMDLTVEESGNPGLLAQCISGECIGGAVDVLHISCHGTIHSKKGPVLMLETEEGDPCPTYAEELAKNLGGNKPNLMFLSACMTSQPDAFLNSYSSRMLRFGVPAVLGWSGSVGDAEANRFAAGFYRYLSQSHSLEEAVARSRQELLEAEKEKKMSGDWHLARLYLGRNGGGVLSKGKEARRRKGVEYGHREFLNVKDQSIPVAGRREFVGRRRQIQQILREFNNPGHAGVLIHGFGRQGKSSLAARIANRLPDHQVVVIYGHYDALAILEGIEYFIGTEEIKNLLSGQKEEVRKNPAALFTILRAIIEGPCKEQPLLLVMDDFEQALDDPEEGELHRVKSHLVETMRAVIEAFTAAIGKTRCRLLLTGRYRFTLPHKSRDLAAQLLLIHLPPMEEYEGRKQAAAKEKVIGVPIKEVDVGRVERCIHAARGNPGLQDLLFSLCLQAPEECDGALAAVEEYIESGKEPDREKLLDFLRNLAIQHLLGLLSTSEKELLRDSTLFQVPVPLETLGHMAQELGLKGEGPVGERLLGFGLWEPFMDMVNPKETAAAIHALARPKVGKLSEKDVSHLAGLVVQDLFEWWGGKENKNRPYAADIELARLALAAQNTTVLSGTAEDAVRGLEGQFQYRYAAKLARESIEILDNAGVEVSDGLFRAGAEVSERIGDMEHARTYIQRAVDKLSTDGNIDSEDYAYALLSQGRMLVNSGDPDKALEVFKEAEKRLRSDRLLRERSIVLGDIARIQVSRGQVEEALKLHQERLEVFDELGDRRSRAVTLGDI